MSEYSDLSTRWTNRGRTFLLTRSASLWSPPNLLFNGYRRHLASLRQWHRADHSPPKQCRVKNAWSHTPITPIFLLGVMFELSTRPTYFTLLWRASKCLLRFVWYVCYKRRLFKQSFNTDKLFILYWLLRQCRQVAVFHTYIHKHEKAKLSMPLIARTE
jgi:hypothetical protein